MWESFAHNKTHKAQTSNVKPKDNNMEPDSNTNNVAEDEIQIR